MRTNYKKLQTAKNANFLKVQKTNTTYKLLTTNYKKLQTIKTTKQQATTIYQLQKYKRRKLPTTKKLQTTETYQL